MSKIIISYKTFPNCYEATQYSRSRAGMSAALRMIGVFLTLFSCVEFITSVSLAVKLNELGNLIDTGILLMGIFVFDFYAFIWRVHQTNFELKLILIDAEYHRVAVYCEEKRSEEFINRCEEKRLDARIYARNHYKKTLQKSAIIYSVCAFVAVFVLIFLAIRV